MDEGVAAAAVGEVNSPMVVVDYFNVVMVWSEAVVVEAVIINTIIRSNLEAIIDNHLNLKVDGGKTAPGL